MSMTKIQVAVELMKHLVDCPSHGYSQYSRLGDGTGTHPVTIDGKTYNVRNGDRDCSSAVIDALTLAGIDCGGATYTGNMRELMCGTGNFEVMPMSYSAQPGDVYLNDGYHTAMCIYPYGSPQGDILAEFSISETGTIDGREGDQTYWESHRAYYYDYPWNCILRYTGRAEGSDYAPPAPQQNQGGMQMGADTEPKRELLVPIHYGLRVLNQGWWPEVTDFGLGEDGYAGAPFTEHDLFYAYCDEGELRYRALTSEDGWLPFVYEGDKNDTVNGCAGVPGHAICGIEMYYTTPDGVEHRQVWYRSQTVERENWLPVCCDDGTTYDAYDGWAGMVGEPMDRIQCAITDMNPF